MKRQSPLTSLAGWLKHFWKRPSSPAMIFSSGLGSSTVSGIAAWTDSRIEQVRHYRNAVYIAVSRICDTVAIKLPNVSVLASEDDDGIPGIGTPHPPEPYGDGEPDKRGWLARARRLDLATKRKALSGIQEHEDLAPAPHNHPLVKLLRDPNPWDTAYEVWYETVMYLMLTGSSYWWVVPNMLGLPCEIWVLPAHWVWPIPGKPGDDKPIVAYQLRPVEGNYQSFTLPADEVIHFRRKSPVSKFDGYSPLRAGSQWVDTLESIQRTRFNTFRNGVAPGVVIEFDEGVAEPDPDKLARIEAKLNARHAGEGRAGRSMLLPPGMKARPLYISPREFDFGASEEQTFDNVLALFGMPRVLSGKVDTMTYGSVRAAQAGFCSFTINPLLAYLGEVITDRLAKKFDDRIRVWWPDRTPEDPEMRERELQTDIKAGAITANEIRALRGRKPMPGGDKPTWLPGGNSPGMGGGQGGHGDGDKHGDGKDDDEGSAESSGRGHPQSN